MLRFVGWRLGQMIVMLTVVSLVTFGLMHLTPGDPAYIMLSAQGVAPTPELLAQTRHDMGLDLPFWSQYLRWVGGIMQGDWGYSYAFSAPVLTVIASRWGITLMLSLVSFLVLLIVSSVLGIKAATTRSAALRAAIELIQTLSNALPTFWLGFMLIVLCALWLHLVPAVASLSNPISFILPVVALAFSYCGRLVGQVSAALTSELEKPYVSGLISRGIPYRRIIVHHVLPNAAAPLLNVAGLMFAAMLAGSITTEVVFSIPGMGMMVLSALAARDYALIVGYVMVCALIFSLVNLIVDIICAGIDPRVRGQVMR